MIIYIGAEELISPLGKSVEENFSAASAGKTGIALYPQAGFKGVNVHLSTIKDLERSFAFENLVETILDSVCNRIDPVILQSPKTLVVISSTKGGLYDSISDPFGNLMERLTRLFKLAHTPLVISNACISGVLAINVAGNLVKSGHYNHVVVIGCDVVSDFVLYGFQSLFAVSDAPCAPFDAGRSGVTLGEGCSAVVVSRDMSIFKNEVFKLGIGSSANDANHISGPSRTGEGLYRSVQKTLESNGVIADNIDYISAHGTGTIYNDEMESIAFDRLGLTHAPLNSLKGFFGHTLGAAGILETAMSMQMMRNGTLLKSMGYKACGTSVNLNVITENQIGSVQTILKTASGFGGGNASLLIQKL